MTSSHGALNSSNDFLDYIYSALTDYTPDNVFFFFFSDSFSVNNHIQYCF